MACEWSPLEGGLPEGLVHEPLGFSAEEERFELPVPCGTAVFKVLRPGPQRFAVVRGRSVPGCSRAGSLLRVRHLAAAV